MHRDRPFSMHVAGFAYLQAFSSGYSTCCRRYETSRRAPSVMSARMASRSTLRPKSSRCDECCHRLLNRMEVCLDQQRREKWQRSQAKTWLLRRFSKGSLISTYGVQRIGTPSAGTHGQSTTSSLRSEVKRGNYLAMPSSADDLTSSETERRPEDQLRVQSPRQPLTAKSARRCNRFGCASYVAHPERSMCHCSRQASGVKIGSSSDDGRVRWSRVDSRPP